jgi:hypothetical protein
VANISALRERPGRIKGVVTIDLLPQLKVKLIPQLEWRDLRRWVRYAVGRWLNRFWLNDGIYYAGGYCHHDPAPTQPA